MVYETTPFEQNGQLDEKEDLLNYLSTLDPKQLNELGYDAYVRDGNPRLTEAVMNYCINQIFDPNCTNPIEFARTFSDLDDTLQNIKFTNPKSLQDIDNSIEL